MKRAFAILALGALLAFGPAAAAFAAPRGSAIAGPTIGTPAAPALSALVDSGEGSGSSHEELFKWINFLIMVGVLGYFLRQPAADFFADRTDTIRRGLDEGRRALAAAEARLAEVERKLNNLQQEVAAFTAESERTMHAERERLKQSAQAEAERIMAFAKAQIESAARAARNDLKRFAAVQAVDLAEALIRQRLDDPLRHGLVARFARDLKRSEARN